MNNRSLIFTLAIFVIGGSSFAEDLGASRQSEDPFVMVALGDSISAGFNAEKVGDNRQLSWSTGDSVVPAINSHYQRMKQFVDRPIETHNESLVGSRVWILERQAQRAIKHVPHYVTIDIGANDVCTWPWDHYESLAKFEDTVDGVVRSLVNAREDVQIVLMPVPDIYNLWELGRFIPGCQIRWKHIGICQKILGEDATMAEREEFKLQWRDANYALQRVALRWPDNVRFDIHIANYHFALNEVSRLDCFHPSVAGQNKIAELTWASGWYSPVQ